MHLEPDGGGAEIAELVGLYLLHQLKCGFPTVDFGLYRDDGLGAHPYIPGPQLERIRKGIIQFFNHIQVSGY